MTARDRSRMAEDIRNMSPIPASRNHEDGSTPAPEPHSPGRSGLTDTQRMLIEQRVSNDKPSTAAAYLLDIFLGAWGAHRFYLGETGTAVAMLILGLTVVGLIISGPWAIIDLFLIPGIIQRRSEKLRQQLTLDEMSRNL